MTTENIKEQPAKQEPVAWLHPANATCVTTDPTAYARGIPLYTSPQPAQQQEPVGSVYRYGRDSSGKQWHGIRWMASGLDLPDGTLIYTSPPAQRKPLTDERTMAAYKLACSYGVYESNAFSLIEKMFLIFKENT